MNAKATLLVVEDDHDLQEVLFEQLQLLPINIVLAENGASALKIVNGGERTIDAILSDINMPEMNGLELLKNLREMDNFVPFVFLTGYGDKAKVIEALKLGAFDFLEKPYQQSELFSVIKKSCELGQQLSSLEEESGKDSLFQNLDPIQLAKVRDIKRQLLVMKKTMLITKRRA
ncbi:MAG: hypothetical protein A4S09_03645 [Proteobacteria bacterium SG_bin7]|nr:MAG: hypothetical protein A4S09_03645 [Proteobacteria bacterium SG_bin7]